MSDIPRLYDALLREHFRENRQMAFLSGPRQVGKTTLARGLAAVYLNWRYSDSVAESGKVLGESTLVSGQEQVSGEELQLAPMNPYVIYCTVDEAYQSADATLVHSGETVYIKCTHDGSHRAVGVVTNSR